MNYLKKNAVGLCGIRSLILAGLIFSSFTFYFTPLIARSFRGSCSTLLSETTKRSGKYLRIIKSRGEVTKTNFPQIVPVGFGKKWSIEEGVYDPPKKQISLVVKKKVIGLFLTNALIDNQKVQFTADTCGFTSDEAQPMQFLITPQLQFTRNLFKFKGTLVRRKNLIEGTFSAQNEFLLTANTKGIKPGERHRGNVEGKFSLTIESTKIKRTNLIDDSKSDDTHSINEPVQALW